MDIMLHWGLGVVCDWGAASGRGIAIAHNGYYVTLSSGAGRAGDGFPTTNAAARVGFMMYTQKPQPSTAIPTV